MSHPSTVLRPIAAFSVAILIALLPQLTVAQSVSSSLRTGQPYVFDVRFPDAKPIARLIVRKDYNNGVGPLPRLSVCYSAPGNLDSLARVSRLEFSGNCKRTVKLRPVQQRKPTANDPTPYRLNNIDRDTVADRFRRIVDGS
ncbi:MAG: hypothetical protein ABJB74_06620 [Gemmatimonas sp.]